MSQTPNLIASKPSTGTADSWNSGPAALRLRKPGWRDPRLIIGIILMAGAVALGSAAVSAAGDTVAVYAASSVVVTGQELTAGDLTIIHVRIDNHDDHYLTPPLVNDDAGVSRPVAQRAIGAGELIPLSALGDADSITFRPVTLTMMSGSEQGISPTDLVDLWHVPDPKDGKPSVLAHALEVTEVGEGGGPFTLSGGAVITVLVPAEQVQDVLAARASSGSVEVVQLPGSSRTP